jgi:hypothetical protein
MPLNEHLKLMLLPLILSNVIHMVLVKLNVLKWMNIPIWESAFGRNKTWRGVFIIVVLTGLFSILISGIIPIKYSYSLDFEELQKWNFLSKKDLSFQTNCAILGMWLGCMYLLFELPNSWIKRRLGICAGALAESTLQRWTFMLVDKSDSAVGVVLFYGWTFQLSLEMQIKLFIISVIIHISLAWLLYKLRIKSSL